MATAAPLERKPDEPFTEGALDRSFPLHRETDLIALTQAWQQWLADDPNRPRPVPLASLIAARDAAALAWALPEELFRSETERLIRRLSRFNSQQRRAACGVATELQRWRETIPGRERSVAFALEALAWSHALPVLSQNLPLELGRQLLIELFALAHDAIRVEGLADPLAQQLGAGELPLALAYLFPGSDVSQELAKAATSTIVSGLKQLLDGEGFPHAAVLPVSRALFASWTRCGYLANARQQVWPAETKAEYCSLLRHLLRLTRDTGAPVFSRSKAGWEQSLFEAALVLTGEEAAAALYRELRSSNQPKAKTKSSSVTPSVHSEWAQVAVCRRQWRRGSDQMALTYHRGQVGLELNCGSHTLFSGAWTLDLQIAGQALGGVEEWEAVCWVSDSDVDYLELEGQLTGGWRVQRQMALAREDRILFLSDAVLGEAAAEINYRSQLPLVEEVSFGGESETHEGVIRDTAARALVVPLHLPEWRSARNGGALEQAGGGLVLRQQSQGRRLFAPLFLDLEPRRFRRPLTWRRLTVAEQLRIVPEEVAVGYRVQIGDRQWLVYRSLDKVGNRSVLGQNLSTEFVLARFTAKGLAEKLIEIE